MKDLTAFYAELKAAGALTGAFAKAVNENALESFLKANDVDATADEFMALANSELTEEQLDAVAGGANFNEAMLSILSLGIGCAALAIGSAITSGTGNGKKGALLCNDANPDNFF